MLPTAIIPAKNVPYRPRVYTDSFLEVELSNKLSEESCKGSKFTDVHSAPLDSVNRETRREILSTFNFTPHPNRFLLLLFSFPSFSSFFSRSRCKLLYHNNFSSFKRIAPRFINREKKQKGNVLTLEAFDRCKRQNWKERDIYLLALSYSFED